jgi:hypothetical protein
MGGYIKTPVSLTESQLKKLKSGHPVTFRTDPSKPPNHELYLTQTQVNSLNKAKSNGVSKDIKLSKSQLKYGGFTITVPTLLAGIGTAASMAGAAGGITKAVLDKKHNDKIEKQNQRHNKEVEKLLKKTKTLNLSSGKGAYLPRRKEGSGTFLPKGGNAKRLIKYTN